MAGTAQGALFLLIFRYVFGGSIGHTGSLTYVDFFIPGFVVTSVLFSGMGAATGIAEDLQGGLFDRLRSLPIRLLSIISGRVAADTSLLVWSLAVTTFFGVLVGFRTAERRRRRGGRLRAVRPLRVRVLLAVHRPRPGRRQPAGGPGDLVPRLPAVVRLQRLRAGLDHAGLDAGVRQPPAADLHVGHGAPAHRGTRGQAPGGPVVARLLLASLLWSAGIFVVFAPLTVWKLRRS